MLTHVKQHIGRWLLQNKKEKNEKKNHTVYTCNVAVKIYALLSGTTTKHRIKKNIKLLFMLQQNKCNF